MNVHKLSTTRSALSSKECPCGASSGGQILPSGPSTGAIDVEAVIPRQEMLAAADVLAFDFPPVVARIAKEQNVSIETAQGLFEDMLKFLYVCAAYPKERPFFPPPAIDEAWHTMLLFTKQYAEFCRAYFGRFIHHAPLTEEMRLARLNGEVKSYRAVEIAREVFGNLSGNWAVPTSGAADCEQSCCPDYDCGD